MKLREVLKVEHVAVPLSAGTLREATALLSERLVASGAAAEPQRLGAVIRNPWPEDMVTVGEHGFLAHFRTEAVRGLAAALGVSRTPIRWEKDPHRTARVVVLVVAPPRETPTYLQVVGAFARTLADPEMVLALLAAKRAEDVVGLAAFEAVDLPSHLTVRDVMTGHVLTVRPEQTLGDVARFMVDKDIRAVPVVDESGALLGMVTHKELLRYLIPDYLQRTKSGKMRAITPAQLQRGSADPQHMPVREAMARSVLCLSEDQTLSDVANLMNNKEVDRFPVVREGVVVGFLTRADLIRRLVAL